MQAEEQTVKRIKKNEVGLWEMWVTINNTSIHIMENRKEREERKQQKKVFEDIIMVETLKCFEKQ